MYTVRNHILLIFQHKIAVLQVSIAATELGLTDSSGGPLWPHLVNWILNNDMPGVGSFETPHIFASSILRYWLVEYLSSQRVSGL
jgi:hypothetical protein